MLSGWRDALGASLSRIPSDEKGVTAIEYALIAGLIGLIIVTGLTTLSGSITLLFDRIAAGFTGS